MIEMNQLFIEPHRQEMQQFIENISVTNSAKGIDLINFFLDIEQ